MMETQKKIRHNIEAITNDSEIWSPNATTYQKMGYFFTDNIFLDLLTQDQQTAFIESNPCSSLKQMCEECFLSFTSVLAYCIETGHKNCDMKMKKESPVAACDICTQEIAKPCVKHLNITGKTSIFKHLNNLLNF